MNSSWRLLTILGLIVALVGNDQAAAQFPYRGQADGRTQVIGAMRIPSYGDTQSMAVRAVNFNAPVQANWAHPTVGDSLGCQACGAAGGCDCYSDWQGSAAWCQTCPALFRRWGTSYVAIDGSWTFRIVDSASTTGSGAAFGGGGSGRARMSEGYGLGGRIGYQINRSWRSDLSYQFFESPYRWNATFANAQPSSFDGDLKSHVILWNTYVHPCQGFGSYDPYIGGGIGISVNEISDTRELFTGGGGAIVKGDSYVDFAGRLTAGVLIPITGSVHLDINCSGTYIGKARTNNTRNVNGAIQPITPYVFDDNFIGAVTMGLIMTL